MPTLSFKSRLGLDIFVQIYHVAIFTLTTVRVLYRKRTRYLWWDDYTALVAVLLHSVVVTMLWFPYTPADSLLHTPRSLVAAYWVSVIVAFITIWIARISLALAFARIFPAGDATRRFAIGIAIFFTILSASIVTHFAVACSRRDAITVASTSYAQCKWSAAFQAMIITMDFISDAILVVIPIYKLWRVRLPSRQRLLVLGGFSASLLTMSTTVACTIFQLAPSNWGPARQQIRIRLSRFESGNAIIACNIIVLVTYWDTLRRRSLERSSEPNSFSSQKDGSDSYYTSQRSPLTTQSVQQPSSAAVSSHAFTEITITGDYVFEEESYQ